MHNPTLAKGDRVNVTKYTGPAIGHGDYREAIGPATVTGITRGGEYFVDFDSGFEGILCDREDSWVHDRAWDFLAGA